MRKFLTGACLAAALLLSASAVQAGKPGNGGSKPGGGIKLSGGFKPSGGVKPSGDVKPGGIKPGGVKPDGLSKGNGKLGKQGQFDGKMKQGQGGKFKDYHVQHGKKFSQGYCYQGKHHCHWNYQCFWPKYGCHCYYCPYAVCWYYWCEPRCCYLPVSCVEYAPPVEVVNVINSPGAVVSQGAPTDLPPVVPGGPSGAGPVQPFKGGSIMP